jgi:hypothetical protein
MFSFSTWLRPLKVATGFAARLGIRIMLFKRSTLRVRTSPQAGGLRPMTNPQNFSPASGSDEFYKTFAGGRQGGISLNLETSCPTL